MSRKSFNAFTIDSVEIIDAASDGRGVAKFEDKKIFVEKAVPGDIVELYVYEKVKRLFSANLVTIHTPSPLRIEAKCKHFGLCGGCKWQMMSYEGQLSFKTKQVRDIFERIAKVEFGELLPALPSPTPYFYRNKLEFSFGTRMYIAFEDVGKIDQNVPVLGFHGKGAFDKVLNVEECYLQLPIVSEILNSIRHFAIEKEIPFYNIKEQHGFLREISFRSSVATNELMVFLTVKEYNKEYLDMVFTHLETHFSQINHLLWIVNPKSNTQISELPFFVWKGEGFITEKLGGFSFRISPTSFFQTNPRQAETLYGVAKNMLKNVLPEGKNKHKIVYDLYTGTGSIAIYVSDLAEKIVGIEYVESSIIDAKANAERNDLQHLSFFAGDMAKVLTPDFITENGKPDVIITDPPRNGMAPAVVAQILKVRPEYVIYISCHPATQARDADMMREHYEVVTLQPVDMFPQTAHVENVALFRARKEPLMSEPQV